VEQVIYIVLLNLEVVDWY